jgi:hypothetical protein
MTMRKLSVKLLFVVLLAGGVLAWSQATTGSISGRVTDSTDRVIEGAKVSIQAVETGLITTAVTNNSGEFIETALPPNHYTITISASGFETDTIPEFKLDIDQRALFNLALKVGASTTSVVVNDTAPALQVQGGETGQVIGSAEIEDLPSEGRGIVQLMELIPGVNSGGGWGNLDLSVNGQREMSNSVQVNGTEVTGNRNNDTNVVPSLDAMQEFKIVTSAYAPEFGRASGGSVIIETRSGSNNIHGSGYFFYRPTSTAANTALSPAGTIPTLQQKIYGATIGGPIRKDKAFLFLAFEGNRQQSNDAYLSQVPPTNQVTFDAAGDANFSKLTDPYDGSVIPIFNPYFFNANYYAQQFPGNIIPANMVSPGGKHILQGLFPAPENNTLYTNFDVQQFYTINNNVANLRADYTFSQNNRVYLTYDAEQGDTWSSDPYAGHISVQNGGGADDAETDSYENHVVALRYDHVFSPTILNEAGGSFFLSPLSSNNLLAGSTLATQWGLKNVVIPGFPATNNIPQVELTYGLPVGGSTYKPLKFRDINLGFTDGLTWTRGKHNAKFGYEYRHLHSHPNFSLFPTPYEFFYGPGEDLTADPTYSYYDPNAEYYNGGNELADLLLGLPYVTDQGLQLTNPSTTANEHTFYLQDFWQLTPQFNLSYGVRYEYQQPYVEANNNEANFDTTTLLINLAGRGGNPRSLVNSNTTDFMPRLGVAYRMKHSLVLRAGFGTFYSPENDAREDILTKNYPFFTQQQFVDYFDSGYYQFLLPFQLDSGVARSTTINIPSGASTINLANVSGGSTQTVYSEPKNFPTAHSINYNLTVEKQLGNATTAEVSFVGANTRNLSYEVGNYNVNDHLSANIGNVQALMPVGLSNYSSLQAKLHRNFTDGYGILASYTFAHSLDNGPAPFDLTGGSSPQTPFNVGAEYANSNTDVRQRFVGSQMIELPFGRGKRYLKNASGLTDELLGGWQLNSITTLQTGRPFNIVSNSNNKNYPGLRPNLVGNASVSHKTTKEYFNTAAFQVPKGQANSTNAGQTLIVGNTPRNFLYGPGYTNEDLSLFKVLSMPREMKFQIRIECFNVLNTAHWNNPISNMAAGGQFGTITGGYYPRVMQLAGRLTF